MTMTFLNLFLIISALILVGSVLWFLKSMYRISRSVSVSKELSSPVEGNVSEHSDIPPVDSATISKQRLVESIRQHKESTDINSLKEAPYSALKTKEIKATVLWYLFGNYVYEDEILFVNWLYEDNRILSNKEPISVLGDEEGYQKVYDILLRKAQTIA